MRDAAISLNATTIAEENSKQLVDQLEGGSSVAKKVAEELGLRHAYCDFRLWAGGMRLAPSSVYTKRTASLGNFGGII